MGAGSRNLLIVDDSEDDRFFLRRGLRTLACSIVAEVEDGAKAIDYLSGSGGYGDRKRFPVPDVMILDLKMPRMSGFEVLDWLKSRRPAGMSVVVLSNSMLETDIERARSLGADHYVVKADVHETVEAISKFLGSPAGLDQQRKLRL